MSAWDLFFWMHPVRNVRVCAVIFADEGSRGYTTVILKEGGLGGSLGRATWVQIRAAFTSKWMQVYGRPMLIRLDPDWAFRSNEFISYMEDMGLNVEKIPAEAHWKMGYVNVSLKFISKRSRAWRERTRTWSSKSCSIWHHEPTCLDMPTEDTLRDNSSSEPRRTDLPRTRAPTTRTLHC